MDVGKFLEFLAARRRALKWAMFAILALLVVLDVAIPSYYDRFPWESIGGFGAVFGFVACIVILVVSKALGDVLLYRPEDYYDD